MQTRFSGPFSTGSDKHILYPYMNSAYIHQRIHIQWLKRNLQNMFKQGI